MVEARDSGEGKTATVIGATGLIGSKLVELLRDDRHFKTVRVLSRRPNSLHHPNIQLLIIDFADLSALKAAIAGSDALFCTVGTTQRKVKGDEAAYRKVDHDIPVHAAQFCVDTGCPQFLLVSSVGANSSGSSFYLKLKGEVEDRVQEMNIPSVSIFRPSMLLGKRQEFRLGEKIAAVLMRLFAPLIPSPYKPIAAHAVARAMIAACRHDAQGFCIYQYNEMMELQGML